MLMISKKNILIIFYIFAFKDANSQNLILNSSFENYKHCPQYYRSKKNFLPYWYSPTMGTPDYYNECSRYKAGVPKNFSGISEPYSGNGYIGLIIASPTNTIGYYREYIATKFVSKLEYGEKYCLKFYISLADYAKYAIKQFP